MKVTLDPLKSKSSFSASNKLTLSFLQSSTLVQTTFLIYSQRGRLAGVSNILLSMLVTHIFTSLAFKSDLFNEMLPLIIQWSYWLSNSEITLFDWTLGLIFMLRLSFPSSFASMLQEAENLKFCFMLFIIWWTKSDFGESPIMPTSLAGQWFTSLVIN